MHSRRLKQPKIPSLGHWIPAIRNIRFEILAKKRPLSNLLRDVANRLQEIWDGLAGQNTPSLLGAH